jgi:uncharacterized membrane protein HdeD (DUF308 family)
MDDIEESVEKKYGMTGFVHQDIWWLVLIASIPVLAFGIVLFFSPVIILERLIIIFGIVTCVFGIISIIRGLMVIKKDNHWYILLIQGAIAIGIGILLFLWPKDTSIFLVYFLGAWLLITSLTTLTRQQGRKSPLVITQGVLGVILGIFVFFYIEFYKPEILLLLVGLFLVIRGISMIAESVDIKRAVINQQ